MKAHEDFTVRLLLEDGGEKLLSGLSSLGRMRGDPLPSFWRRGKMEILSACGNECFPSLQAGGTDSFSTRMDGSLPAGGDGAPGNAVFLSAAEASRAFREGENCILQRDPTAV